MKKIREIATFVILLAWTAFELALIPEHKDMPLPGAVIMALIIIAGFLASCWLIAERLNREDGDEDRDK